jgi:hypothetical protein
MKTGQRIALVVLFVVLLFLAFVAMTVGIWGETEGERACIVGLLAAIGFLALFLGIGKPRKPSPPSN